MSWFEKYLFASTMKLSSELLYINRPNGLPPVEIIKNPMDRDYQELAREFFKEYPDANTGYSTPKTRTTYDPDGNRYIWRADMGMHEQIEPQLGVLIGKPVNQNKYFDMFWELYPDVNIPRFKKIPNQVD